MYSSSKTSMSDFKIERQLGKGSFSSVYLVTRIADQKIYALKSVTMDKLTKKEQQNSVNEVRILASVSHPNVIGYREAFWDDSAQTLNIVMEYADDGDLQTKIHQMKKNNGLFEEETIWSYAIQMIEGLKALHDKKIMHRDLKSANIFLAKNNNKKICKIGDMNVSKVVKEKVLMTQTGTPYYASPEVWNDKPYSYKSDLWSIGCVIYELCALKPPFKGKDLDELYVNVCKGKVDRIKNIYSDKLWKIILMLLQVDVNKRVNCDQFLNHPIIVQKIREMKMKDSEYVDLEVNKTSKDGCLLNTINFKDLKEIKAQLPTKKNYGNNFENKRDFNYNYNYSNNNNNNFFKKEYFTSLENKKLVENSKEQYNINNDLTKNINGSNMLNNNNENNFNSNYYNYINERINKLLNNNNNYITKNYNINNYKNIYDNNYTNHHSNEHLNIINDKSSISNNKYIDMLNKIKEYNYNILHTEENKNVNSKLYDKEEKYDINKNYNLYDHILQTDVGPNNLIRKDNIKINMNSDNRYTYENMNTEEKIDYNEKIMKLKKEKNKIIEKQRDIKAKTIEDEINEYKKLLNKNIAPVESKFNNYLNIGNYYIHSNNNKNPDINNNKKERTKDKYNKIYNGNYNNNNKTEQKLIKKQEMTLSPNPNNKNKIPTTSTRKGNLDNEITFKKINNVNNKNLQQNRASDIYDNKKTTRHLLKKKNPSFNNFIDRAKTPTSKYINKNSSKVLSNKSKLTNEKKNEINYNNNHTHNSLIKEISLDQVNSLDKRNVIKNIKNNINSIKNTGNPIKRINKPYMNINKKRNTGIDNYPALKTRQKSSLAIKQNNSKNGNIHIHNNNDLIKFDSKIISSKYQHKKIKFDLSKDLNDINLTCVEDNRNKKNVYKMTNENDNSNILMNNNIYRDIKAYNQKNDLNSYNDIKNKKNNITNKVKDFNYMNPNNIQNNKNNQNNKQIMKYAKKLSARSNSYRITSHGDNTDYINKKRKLNYNYDLTEPEEKLINKLKLNTSKSNNSKIINYSLINNGVNMMNFENNNNFNPNDFVNNLKPNINNASKKIDERHFMNINNTYKTPQIFNNYYSINGIVTSSSPIKVINVFNN